MLRSRSVACFARFPSCEPRLQVIQALSLKLLEVAYEKFSGILAILRAAAPAPVEPKNPFLRDTHIVFIFWYGLGPGLAFFLFGSAAYLWARFSGSFYIREKQTRYIYLSPMVGAGRFQDGVADAARKNDGRSRPPTSH